MSDLQRRTEALLRSKGYLTASVERRKRFPDPKSKKCAACGSVRMLDIASDLWNVFDLIAIRPMNTTFVQVTDSTSHSKRRNKIIASAEAKLCILAGARILIQSWKKVQNRYQVHDEWITLDQFVFGLADTAEQFYEDQARLKLLDRKAKLPAIPPGHALQSALIPDSEMPF